MDDLERKLKSLRLSEPSAELRGRIFGEPPRRRVRVVDVFQRRIPLVWAAAAALAMGVIGFAAARMQQPSAAPSAPATVQVRIIEAPAAPHFFDFTETSSDFLPGDFDVKVKTNGEV